MSGPSAPEAIIVGHDGSSHADLALEWASRTAAVERRSVRTVSVVSASDTEPLLDQSLDAHALVCGPPGRGRAADVFLGSVSQRLARRSVCPLIVVRPPASPRAARIVAGVDGSPESITALKFACHRASFTKEPVVALHAWNPGHINVDDDGQLPRRVGQRAKAAEVLLAECIAEARDVFPRVSIEPDSVALTPTVALIEASAHASLVVTGSRARGVLAGLLLGSVSGHLLDHAHCPVAVTH
jgi:nucleotide-binding universal stress UspA family protein